MDRVEYFPFLARHRPLCQFEYKYIEFRRLLQLSFFSAAISYLKWWPQVRWEGLYNKRTGILLGLRLRDLHFCDYLSCFVSFRYCSFIYRSTINQGSYECGHQ